MKFGSKLSEQQWEIVKHFASLSGPFFAQTFNADDLGRAACKVENVSAALGVLRQAATENHHKLDTYCKSRHRSAGFAYKRDGVSDHHTVATGQRLKKVKLEAAKDICADRLQFPNSPSFDPSAVFDAETLTAYRDPGKLRIPNLDLDTALKLAPKVKVRGSASEQLKLFKKLDDGSRIYLENSEEFIGQPKAGLVDVHKNKDKDRLVLDARPPNLCEISLSRWTCFMAIISVVLGFYIPPGFVAALFADD